MKLDCASSSSSAVYRQSIFATLLLARYREVRSKQVSGTDLALAVAFAVMQSRSVYKRSCLDTEECLLEEGSPNPCRQIL